MAWKTENAGAPRRVVVTKDLPGERWREALRRAGCEICWSTSRHALSVREIIEGIGPRCDGVIGQLTEPWGADLFDALSKAGGHVYSNYAVGYDNVRVPEATRRKIAVGNTPGVLTETTAELAVALTFAAARRTGESERYLRAGEFRGWLPDLFLGRLLEGTTLGIVGAGRIGVAYARRMAAACSMDVVYFSRSESKPLEDVFEALGALARAEGREPPRLERVESLDRLLERADVVSLHVPLTDATRHLIDARRLGLMKRDAILINTARGPVIDEVALVRHLRSSSTFRVGLDVFEDEPQLAHGLADRPNAVVVPHIGSATTWTREGMATLAACNVAGMLHGHPVATTLDPSKFLEGDFPPETPSIVNHEELSLPTS